MEIRNKFFLFKQTNKQKRQKKGKRERQGYFFGLQAQLLGFSSPTRDGIQTLGSESTDPNHWLSLFSHPVVSDSLQPHGLQHARLPCPSPSPEICPSLSPLHQWGHPAISSSDTLFPFCLQSFPQSGTFPANLMLFSSDDQNTGASASASVLPMSIQGWFPLRLIGLISLLYRDFQESSLAPQFEGINSLELCLLYGPALRTIQDHQEDHSLDYSNLCWQSNVSAFQHTV